MVEFLDFELSYYNVLLYKILLFGQCFVLTVHKHDGCVRGWEGLPIEPLGTGKHFQEARGGDKGPYIRLRGRTVFVFSGGNSMHQSLWEVK
jgi:hypothetical protein